LFGLILVFWFKGVVAVGKIVCVRFSLSRNGSRNKVYVFKIEICV